MLALLSNEANSVVAASEERERELEITDPSLTSASIRLMGVVVAQQPSCYVEVKVGRGADNAVIMEISMLRGPETEGYT